MFRRIYKRFRLWMEWDSPFVNSGKGPSKLLDGSTVVASFQNGPPDDVVHKWHGRQKSTTYHFDREVDGVRIYLKQ